jgi:hypothetical protein
MILDRLYEPRDGEIVYHYCGPEAFLQIIKSRTIWASADHTLNDHSEGVWGYHVFGRALNELRDELGPEFCARVSAIVDLGRKHPLAMIASFSLDGDVKSQWTSYADDGHGVAVGFAADQLRVPAKPLRVIYDEEAQVAELKGNLRHTHAHERSRAFAFGDEFDTHWFHAGLDLCAYKNAGFSEEKEIRWVHMAAIVPGKGNSLIRPLGARGPNGERLSKPVPVQFRTSNGRIVPYVAIDFTDHGKRSPVAHVVLGPCNRNSTDQVEVFLASMGLDGVTVRRSAIPYRSSR